MGDLAFKTSRECQYRIVTEPGILASVGSKLRALADRAEQAVIVTDRHVGLLYANDLLASLTQAGFRSEVLEVEPGELSKSLPAAMELWDQLVGLGFRRKSVLVALGGGVVTDLTGFVAAGFMRGVSYANVPTTLVAQLDAAVGSKVGVNHGRAKNLIGFFHHPLVVYNDPAVLRTLPPHEVRQGLAEAIKAAVIGSSELFEYLESHMAALLDQQVGVLGEVVMRSVEIKCRLLERDLYESDLCRALNFGHAIGHALETAAGYERMSHGDAISIGMATVARLAASRGILAENTANRIERLLAAAGLPTSAQAPDIILDRVWDALAVVRLIRDGRLNEVLPTAIGQCMFTDDISNHDLQRHLYS